MKIFFRSTFIKEEALNEARIDHPIKLEYYKIINKEENLRQEKAKFGIYIVKKEYKEGGLRKENEKIQYLTDDEKQIERILDTLERNQVTPIGLQEIINEMSYQIEI